MANKINALLFLLVVLLLSLYDITGQGLNDVSIDEMTTPVEVTPEELKSQSLEEFQRARLEQQLRVMRNERQKMNKKNHTKQEEEDNQDFDGDG